ncbi:hypothetical protein BC938DRAFT_470916 [Jimgerdemannia flammicorona]|uniref:Uncharacterized protein n=1 Tax=Jimgerdemannia flammicorona TaxID=994334 RepID=A0A433Q971_9FUNG|nr:hypothetical protein BC938DRAFT_470916 [Jimgerdemannia flammicorona]
MWKFNRSNQVSECYVPFIAHVFQSIPWGFQTLNRCFYSVYIGFLNAAKIAVNPTPLPTTSALRPISSTDVLLVVHDEIPIHSEPPVISLEVPSTDESYVISLQDTEVASTDESHVISLRDTEVASTDESHVVSLQDTEVASTGESHVVSLQDTEIASTDEFHVIQFQGTEVASTDETHLISLQGTEVASTDESHVISLQVTDVASTDESHSHSKILRSPPRMSPT